MFEKFFSKSDTTASAGAEPTEETSLLSPGAQAAATQLEEKARIYKNYDVNELASVRVFTKWTGTVFQDKGLWMETGALMGIYVLMFMLCYCVKWEGFSQFVGKEESVRAFIAMFSTLIGLLLSFYTALNLQRWWKMREGVHDIECACARLMLLISQTCTRDPKLLSAVHRYSRASLWLVFAASQDHEHPREEAVERGMLTEDEAEQLRKLNPHMTFVQASTLWVWLANLVTRLNEQGLTKGPPHFCALLAAVEMGRNGIANIETYLTTQIPMPYVHLLCFMVKLHNILLASLMAVVGVSLLGSSHHINPLSGVIEGSVAGVPLFRTCFRGFFMPFLYNCILVINTGVTDPFGKDACDFDFRRFDIGMEATANAFIDAETCLPAWMAENPKFAKFANEAPKASPV